jgi:hypothetical protein
MVVFLVFQKQHPRTDGAVFTLHRSSPRCHSIIAYGAAGKWHINVDGHLVNTDNG